MNPQLMANVVFLVLLLAYSGQLLFISKKIGSNPGQTYSGKSSGDLWFFVALSIIGPVLLGVLPELLLEALREAFQKVLPPPSTVPIADSRPLTAMQVGAKFMIAYLIIIVTLELALQIQAHQANKENAWVGFLITNLSFDIISILVFQMVNAILGTSALSAPGVSVYVFFVMCAVPTILTGVIVVCGSYSALTAGHSR